MHPVPFYRGYMRAFSRTRDKLWSMPGEAQQVFVKHEGAHAICRREATQHQGILYGGAHRRMRELNGVATANDAPNPHKRPYAILLAPCFLTPPLTNTTSCPAIATDSNTPPRRDTARCLLIAHHS